MADAKISALTNLTAADAINDMIPIVDVSDTPPASGNTKRISINNLLSSSPTASGALTVTGLVTAGSATITGDLTVDTSTLKVDSTNDNVIVGATSAIGGGRFSVQADLSAKQGICVKNSAASYGASNNLIRFTNSSDASIGGITHPAVTSLGIWGVTETQFFLGAGATTAMTLNSTGLGVGGSPIASHFISVYGPICVTGTAGGTRTSYISNASTGSIYYTDGGASYPFDNFGNLIIQPRTSAARSVVIATGSTTPVERAVVKSTGQVRFVPLAADPAGAESGDVYYNSVSNKLKCYNGTTWNDLF